jgi:ribosome biogenesis GTP-binding protein YsxC/EngB
MQCLKRFYSIAGNGKVNKYDKLAELLNREAFISKSSPQLKTASKKTIIKGIRATDINKKFAELCPISTKWKLGSKERSDIGKFLTLADIKHEMSIYDYEKLANNEDEDNNGNYTPEVLFLGRCNVGKSTLINALLSKSNQKTADVYARVKAEAGYTPCLNFYNVGGAFRIVDTPGYGIKGQQWQGKLIYDYLQDRNNLMSTFIMIDASVGVTPHDEEVLRMLQSIGVQYNVILNKIDKIPEAKRIEQALSVGEGVKSVGDGLWRRTFAVASAGDTRDRDGVGCLFWSMWDVCGFPSVHHKKVFQHSTVKRERAKRERKEKREVKRREKMERLEQKEKNLNVSNKRY